MAIRRSVPVADPRGQARHFIMECVEAYELRGTGSTRERVKELVGLYESAAPAPNEMPGPDANEFLFELRELVAQSVEDGGGELRGWKRLQRTVTETEQSPDYGR